MSLAGKRVLVTGANGGIGAEIVKELLLKGADRVYAAARDKSALKPLCSLDSVRVVPVELDITNADSVGRAADTCGDIDILINNAGVNNNLWLTSQGGFDSARHEMEVNFFGTLLMCRSFAPILTAKGKGTIANVCSIIGMVSMPVNGTYCASKAALHSMTQGLRGEMAPRGVNVIGIYPGPVDTRLTEGLNMPKASPSEAAKAIVEGIIKGEAVILPDNMSKELYKNMLEDYTKVEEEMLKVIPS